MGERETDGHRDREKRHRDTETGSKERPGKTDAGQGITGAR